MMRKCSGNGVIDFFFLIFVAYPIMISAFQMFPRRLVITTRSGLGFQHHQHLLPQHNHQIKKTITTLARSSSSDQIEIKTLDVGSHVAEMEVKKSRFIGYAKHVQNWEDAKAYIEEVKTEHPKARHWCYAMRCGSNPVQARSNDDGEPTGTAGVPILGMI